jgi:RNase P/RNase MRP subunit p30
MSIINQSVFAAIGEGSINQNIVEAAAEIIAAETPKQVVAAVQRYKNFVLIAARGLEMQAARA